MFKTLPCLANDDFWRVSADTKTCGIPLYLAPTGGLCLPLGKHTGILTYFQTKINKKITQKELFPVILSTVEGSTLKAILP